MAKSKLVQVRNPRSNRYTLIDREAGQLVKHKSTPGPYAGVPVVVRRKAEKQRKR